MGRVHGFANTPQATSLSQRTASRPGAPTKDTEGAQLALECSPANPRTRKRSGPVWGCPPPLLPCADTSPYPGLPWTPPTPPSCSEAPPGLPIAMCPPRHPSAAGLPFAAAHPAPCSAVPRRLCSVFTPNKTKPAPLPEHTLLTDKPLAFILYTRS